MSPIPAETQSPSAVQTESPHRTIRLSACIIAKDAARTLPNTLPSLQFCDEIVVVVDSASSDATEQIARGLATQVELRTWEGFTSTWRYALSRGNGDWLLMIAADEMISKEMAQSILEVTRKVPPERDAYLMRRCTRLLGRFLRHGDWSRDHVLRLIRRDKVAFNDNLVHESLKSPGNTAVLDGFLLHEGDRSIEEHAARQKKYAALAAQGMFAQGRNISWLAMVLKTLFRFVRSYILLLGFLDGWPGFVQAWYSSVYVLDRSTTLRALNRKKHGPRLTR